MVPEYAEALLERECRIEERADGMVHADLALMRSGRPAKVRSQADSERVREYALRMSGDGGLFTNFRKERRPLSAYLSGTLGSQARLQVMSLTRDELTPGALRKIVEDVRVDPPRLGGIERGQITSGSFRPVGPSERAATTRVHVAIEVEGEHDLLAYWPDQTGADLDPVDVWTGPGDPWAPNDPFEPFDVELALQTHEHEIRSKLWNLGRHKPQARQALFTFVDVTEEEAYALAGGVYEVDPRALVDENLASIRPIVDAIGSQINQYFGDELPRELDELAAGRRKSLDGRAALLDNLTWPIGWKQPPLGLTDDSHAPSPGGTSKPGLDPSEAEIHLPPSRRLSDASFEDVMRTIRVWATGVERYPDAFCQLSEDHLSDMLAATLNAALPGADREVYNRRGKSDILVKGKAVDDGAGPEPVYICESKWWSGSKAVDEALEQLEGYLQVRDTAATLVIFFKNQRHRRSAEAAVGHLRQHEAFRRDLPGPVDGWPELDFQMSDRRVRLCLATIAIPPARSKRSA